MKGETEILSVRVDTLEIITTAKAWDVKGNPTEWHIDLLINNWLHLAIVDVTNWHEFTTVEA